VYLQHVSFSPDFGRGAAGAAPLPPEPALPIVDMPDDDVAAGADDHCPGDHDAVEGSVVAPAAVVAGNADPTCVRFRPVALPANSELLAPSSGLFGQRKQGIDFKFVEKVLGSEVFKFMRHSGYTLAFDPNKRKGGEDVHGVYGSYTGVAYFGIISARKRGEEPPRGRAGLLMHQIPGSRIKVVSEIGHARAVVEVYNKFVLREMAASEFDMPASCGLEACVSELPDDIAHESAEGSDGGELVDDFVDVV
jgi:hypothetical protein